MYEIKIKRIYAGSSEDDGYRILIDRLWPRGISKEKININKWAKEISPSTELRKTFKHDPDTMDEFKKRYYIELDNNEHAVEFINLIKIKLKEGDVTLLYAAKNEEFNHAVILKEWLEGIILERGKMDKIKLTQVVNAGLLIERNDTKILIDGIHNEKMPEWSTVDKALMDYIIYGKYKFKDIDYLLFTHRHGDHFNLEKTLEYIKNNKVKKLVAAKINNTYINSDKLEELNTDYYEVYIINSSDIIIRCIKTKHLSHEKFGIEHYVFIININNKNILYLGDADYTKSELINVLENFEIDIIVAPFIITTSTPGRNFVKKIAPELLILNHLPCKEDDEYNYRNMAEKSIAQHSDEMPETIIFQDLYDELIID